MSKRTSLLNRHIKTWRRFAKKHFSQIRRYSAVAISICLVASFSMVGHVAHAQTIDMINPFEGESVSGSITLAASVTSFSPTGVTFFIPQGKSSLSFPATPGKGGNWSTNLDTTTLPNGSYQMFAEATDGVTTIDSATVNFTISNAAPPTITVLSPVDGSNVSSTVDLVATSTAPVDSMEFSIDSDSTIIPASLGGDGNWHGSWNVSALAENSNHQIFARATVGANTYSSVTISANIDNIAFNIISPVDSSSPVGNIPLEVGVTAPAQPGSVTFTFLTAGFSSTTALTYDSGSHTWKGTLDISKYSNAVYTVTVNAYSGAPTGSPLDTSPAIFVTLNNPTLNVNVTAPVNGATVAGVMPMNATVSQGADSLDFVIMRPLAHTRSATIPATFNSGTGKWEASINTATTFFNGTYEVTAVASKAGFALTTSPPVSINISNSGNILKGILITPTFCQEVSGLVPIIFHIEPKPDSVTFNFEDFHMVIPTTHLSAQYDPSTDNWVATWDTTHVPSSTYWVTQTLSLPGYIPQSYTVPVAIGSPCAVELPPAYTNVTTVSINQPTNNAMVTGTTSLMASASPQPASVTFLVYGTTGLPFQLPAMLQNNEWTANWNTLAAPNGSYAIVANAINNQNTPFTSPEISVQVNNSGSTSTTSTPLIVPIVQRFDLGLGSDPTAIGVYTAQAAMDANPTIDVDLEIAGTTSSSAHCTQGSLLKTMSESAVYYCGMNGKRYVFPNEKVYFSWYNDFSDVLTIDPSLMESIPLGGVVNLRPGVGMIKTTTDPKVYALSRDRRARWVSSEDVAKRLYGVDWNKKITDVTDDIFSTYFIGSPIY